MEEKIDCFMVHHIPLTQEIAVEICAAAHIMIRGGQRSQTVVGSEFTGELNTKFVKVIDFETPGKIKISGFIFNGTIDLGKGPGRVCLIVSTEMTLEGPISISAVELFPKSGEDETICILCPSAVRRGRMTTLRTNATGSRSVN